MGLPKTKLSQRWSGFHAPLLKDAQEMQQPPIFEGVKPWLVAFSLRSGIIPAKPYPVVSYALLYQATG